MNSIDYSNIHFSEEETTELIGNRKKICEYLRDNIVVNMPKDNVIRIDFGGKFTGKNSIKETTNYHLYIYDHPTWFPGSCSCGIESRYITIGYSEKYGMIKDLETCNLPHVIFAIVYNWNNIKKQIDSKFKDVSRIKDMISNFTV